MKPNPMQDPFCTQIIFALESKILETDRLAQRRKLNLTDAQICSTVKKLIRAVKDKPVTPAATLAGREKLLAGLFQALFGIRGNIREKNHLHDGSASHGPVNAAIWLPALEALKESIQGRTTAESASRGYLDFLGGFLERATKAEA